jgi:hypothetical protein
MSLSEQMLNEDMERILLYHMNRTPVLELVVLSLSRQAGDFFRALKKRNEAQRKEESKDILSVNSQIAIALLAEKGNPLKDQERTTALFKKHFKPDIRQGRRETMESPRSKRNNRSGQTTDAVTRRDVLSSRRRNCYRIPAKAQGF